MAMQAAGGFCVDGRPAAARVPSREPRGNQSRACRRLIGYAEVEATGNYRYVALYLSGRGGRSEHTMNFRYVTLAFLSLRYYN